KTIIHERRRNSRALHLCSLQERRCSSWRRICSEVPVKDLAGSDGDPWWGVLVVDNQCRYLVFARRCRREWDRCVVWFEKATPVRTNVYRLQCLDRKVQVFRKWRRLCL